MPFTIMKWVTRLISITVTRNPIPAREINRSIPDENARVNTYTRPHERPSDNQDRKESRRLLKDEWHVSEAGFVDRIRRNARESRDAYQYHHPADDHVLTCLIVFECVLYAIHSCLLNFVCY